MLRPSETRIDAAGIPSLCGGAALSANIGEGSIGHDCEIVG